jgi:adenine-specific DNA-methyltransferase
MRFIGNKENLVDRIYQIMQKEDVTGQSFFDFFSGTASVGKYFKKLNYQIFSSDILYFSYVLQRAYIVNNEELKFKKLLGKIKCNSNLLLPEPLLLVVEYLNKIEPVEGFIYKNYTPSGTHSLKQPRMYYSDENGKRIDAIRQQIEKWGKRALINDNEYFVLLACLIETVPFYANIAGVYGAFQKKWDARAIKKLVLRPIGLVINKKENYSYNDNSTDLLKKVKADIFYLDPPYNQRQYAPNYHLLETIAKYDNPEIRGVAGLRNYEKQKSSFCNKITAIQELSKIAREGKYKTLVLSYNTEGIMPQEKIISALEEYGKVKLVEFQYLRFKSNNNGDSKHKKFINEQLYILKKYEK